MAKTMAKDMTAGSPAKILFLFALPMVIANVFQQLYNVVDSVIVGNYVGEEALAAVGTSSPIVFMTLAVCIGLSNGFAVVISQFFGAREIGKVKNAIFTALITTTAVGGVVSLLSVVLPGFMLRLLKTPGNIFADADAYLTVIFAGMIFQFMYNSLTSIFNALGNSKAPLVFLLLSAGVNVALDLLFVAAFQMGTAGAAYATIIAQAISMALSFLYLIYKLRSLKPAEGDDTVFQVFDFILFKRMMRIAVPSTIQQSIVSVGALAVQGLVNTFGSTVIAGYNAAMKLDQLAMMPILNLCNALATFTAQNLGAGKPDRPKKGFRAAILLSVGASLSLSLLFRIFGVELMGFFVDSDVSQGVIATGAGYMNIVSAFYFLLGIMFCSNAVLRGSGHLEFFIASTFVNLAVRVAASYGLAALTGNYEVIWWAIPIGWAAGGLVSMAAYLSGKWQTSTIVAAPRKIPE